MTSSASHRTTPELVDEILRLRDALVAIQNTPRRAGILTCQRIASDALAGMVVTESGEVSLGNPFYYRAAIDYLRDRYGEHCAYCRLDFTEIQIDHVLPVSCGGSDAIGNLVLACRPCNKAKGTQTSTEFGFPDVTIRAAGQVLPKWKGR